MTDITPEQFQHQQTPTPMWMKQARKRAEARTFVVPVDSKGRAKLSFYISAAPRKTDLENAK